MADFAMTGRTGSAIEASLLELDLSRFLDRNRSDGDREWIRRTGDAFQGQQVPSPSDVCQAVSALYSSTGSSRPEVSLNAIYRTLRRDGSKTLLLLRDTKEILREWKEKDFHKNMNKNQRKKNPYPEINNNPALTTSGDGSEDEISSSAVSPLFSFSWNNRRAQSNIRLLPADDNFLFRSRTPSSGRMSDSFIQNDGESPFSELFSDDEDIIDTHSETDKTEVDETELNRGFESFLQGALERKRRRQRAPPDGDTTNFVGLEHRLMAAATCHKEHSTSGSAVMKLDFLTVRRKWRRRGLGTHLLKNLKSSVLSGPYDALVLHSGRPAHSFFLKRGFTDDIVLNSAFRELEDVRKNGISMCYLPTLEVQEQPLATIPGESDLVLRNVDEDNGSGISVSLDGYQAQVVCMTRIYREILRLHGKAKTQEASIDQLRRENRKLQNRLTKTEKHSTCALLAALERESQELERLCLYGFAATCKNSS